MTLEVYRQFCLSKPGVTEELPFGPETLVFKVMGKMFTATDLTDFQSINYKASPEEIEDQRERYPSVVPGYHMSKKHWNTVMMDGSVPDNLILQWIDQSYQLVVDKLPSKLKNELLK